MTSSVDETALSVDGDDPVAFVELAATAKAVDVATGRPGDVVIGSDTVVVHRGRRLGKQATRTDAEATLGAMRGERVDIHTALAVATHGGSSVVVETVSCGCWIADVDDSTLDRYLDSGTWTDKAGALAIQHREPSLVASIEGCIPSALGLPLCRLAGLLAAATAEPEMRRRLESFACRIDQTACPIAMFALDGL